MAPYRLLSSVLAATLALVVLPVPAGAAADPPDPDETVCDFDDDGHNDLAVGVPGEDNRGAVNIEYHDGYFPHVPAIIHPPGDVEGGSDFGAALSCGDFDHDGVADLAVGAPQARPGGRVYIYWGDTQRPLRSYVWFSQNNSHVPGTASSGEWFGFSLAAGDFNADGRDDLAVGIPRDSDPEKQAGSVAVVYGSAAGWLNGPLGPVSLLTGGYKENPLENSHQLFGWSLAAAPLVAGGGDDLAVGAPATSVPGDGFNCTWECILYAGRVYVFRSQVDSLLSYQMLEASDFAAPAGQQFARFGTSLAAGDFDGSGGSAGLAIGAPDHDVPGASYAGLVYVARGSGAGPVPEYDGVLEQSDAGGAVETGDRFGTALAAGDLDVDGIDDLAVGVPGEDVKVGSSDAVDAGAVFVVYGSSSSSSYWQSHRVLVQGTYGLAGSPETHDYFGGALAVLPLLAYDDLVIGAPGEEGPSGVQPDTDHAGHVMIAIGYPDQGPVSDPELSLNQDTGAPYHVADQREVVSSDAPVGASVTFVGAGEWFGWSMGQ
ncbi:FG-GAP-like repeat-containing protein [Myceligenerans pegani]|uniref:FG-GAP repeat protein n=1 Tax=Myceligenerans pegani TaxID=2776917 RepID=A0ABR9N3T9_9MICO|nr:FG-GAP-like repeat-containing protein [Myceligenerans sp. TRM 65318]MBE1877672.1 FG-GAP repeat protein [Myceligenerans sp. TRM 65318]MBE3019943.1 FG-GAP repeat protein [Myceligenerans sp. TRM 65318]